MKKLVLRIHKICPTGPSTGGFLGVFWLQFPHYWPFLRESRSLMAVTYKGPVMVSSDASSMVSLNKLMNKQTSYRWCETLYRFRRWWVGFRCCVWIYPRIRISKQGVTNVIIRYKTPQLTNISNIMRMNARNYLLNQNDIRQSFTNQSSKGLHTVNAVN